MDWDKLRIFKAVAHAQSFSRAGPEIGISQSALSRQISALEQDLGVMLFHRHARGLILTEQGEILYQTVLDVFQKLAATKERLSESKGKASGELRITSTIGLGSLWLTPLLPEFLDLHPGIDLTLVLDDKELDLSMREADVAIRLRRPIQPDLLQRKLFTAHYHLYAHPSYLAKKGAPKSIEDLDKHTLLSFGVAPGYLSEINWIETIGRRSGPPRPSLLRINNLYALKKIVEAGLGLAVLPDYLVRKDSAFVLIDIGVAAPSFDTYLVYPQERKNSMRVSVFRDFIVEKARKWDF